MQNKKDYFFSKRLHRSDFILHKYATGFTLIELLVVIAIVGILSSVVLTNLNSSRQKARDVKRTTDLKSIQLALQLFLDTNSGKYPGTLSALVPDFLPSVPVPPGGVSGADANYVYRPLNVGGGTCNSYHLGTALELDTNIALTNDSNATPGTVASEAECNNTGTPATPDFYGASVLCNGTSGANKCFDITP